ncbi:ATP-binding protein [Actinacidiphila oryziradicis]|uniref:ATP-binding protein n=1 Tax=Actinacidiphila oryziradicis TaxID=2571141 RepID=UPI00145DFB76|nr:ATP-binding protein [Actinacidiphila oryziradicis]
MDQHTDASDEFGDESGAQPYSAEDSPVPPPRTQRPSRDPNAADIVVGAGAGEAVRVVEVVAGDYLVTVNPVDGSEVTALPPDGREGVARRTPESRAAREASARPPVPPGPRAVELPLLEREEERERLARLLSRGRSVRVTGPSGSGRSVLLDAVAEGCSQLAPDGVIRLSGYHRTLADLLHDLFTAVYESQAYRPDRSRLLELLREVGAVVVLDDLEFGGPALEELLDAVPECAFLMSATPDVAAPASDSAVEEVFLPGLTRVACLELLEKAVQRPLEDEEAAWAADLWFESEGLPLRFVQAGALLRQRDARGLHVLDGDEPVWDTVEDDLPVDAPLDALPASHISLPSLGESAAPAELLASRLSEAAQETLRFAVALGGECPHQAHLPALVGDTHGDAALGEIVAAGLALPVASHYRLAAGVREQLVAAAYVAAVDTVGTADTGPEVNTAALHYAWWVGHPSVTPERVAAEAEAVLAALAAARDVGHHSTAVLLARTAAPVFAAALEWSVWERALRIGQETARITGEVAEEAYFLHELGVLSLLSGNLDRARTELEASIGLRGALADRQGTTVGRRTLALVVDRSGGPVPATTPAGVETAAVGAEASVSPVIVSLPAEAATAVHPRLAPARTGLRRIPGTGSRRNVAAAGAGALIAAVLGTLVTLGSTANTSENKNVPSNVKPLQSAQQDNSTGGLPAQSSAPGALQSIANPSGSADASASSGTSGTTTAPGTGAGTTTATTPGTSTRPSTTPPTTPKPTTSKPTSKPPTNTPPTNTPPTGPSPTTSSPTATAPTTPASASDTVSSAPVTTIAATPSESVSSTVA